MPPRSRGQLLLILQNAPLRFLSFLFLSFFDPARRRSATTTIGVASSMTFPSGFTVAGRVAPFGKPPSNAPQVPSPLQGHPFVISSQCSCGSARIDFRYNNSNNNSDDRGRDDIIDCHCAECRRFHVAAFVRYLRVPENDVSVTGDSVVRFRDSCAGKPVWRTYCRRCSTKLLTQYLPNNYNNSGNNNNDKALLVNMGPLDGHTIPRNVARQWVKTMPQLRSPNMEASWTRAVPPPSSTTTSLNSVAAAAQQQQQQQPQQQPNTITVTGGCTCGACQYEFELRKPLELQHCYCSLCRQLSGAPFMTWIPIRAGSQNFRWLLQGTVTKTNAGTPQRASVPDGDGGVFSSSSSAASAVLPPKSQGEAPLVRYTDIGQRHVCQKCGGVLSIWYDSDGNIATGSEEGHQPDFSIWLAAGGLDSIRLPFYLEPYLDRVVHICCNYKPDWYTLPDDDMPRLGEAS